MNMAIKYSLFYSWQVNYLKTKLTAKSLRQICDVSKVCTSAAFWNQEKLNNHSVNSPAPFNSQIFMINKRSSTVKSAIFLVKLNAGVITADLQLPLAN